MLARAPDGMPSGRVHPSVAAMLARTAAPRDGRSLNPNEFEEIEGRGPRLSRTPSRTLQRLKITQITPDSQLSTGDCGARNVQWIFSLDKPAPEDGYIV